MSLPIINIEKIAPPLKEKISPIPDKSYQEARDTNALFRILIHLNPKVVFEFGTAYGNTTANICDRCKNATVFTINAFSKQITPQMHTMKIEDSEIGEVYRKCQYQDRVFQILNDSYVINLLDYFNKPEIDLCIIDGCHETRYVMSDFLNVFPFVSKKGIILFHDTSPALPDKRSYNACVNLREFGFDIRYLSGTTWGIWKNDGF